MEEEKTIQMKSKEYYIKNIKSDSLFSTTNFNKMDYISFVYFIYSNDKGNLFPQTIFFSELLMIQLGTEFHLQMKKENKQIPVPIHLSHHTLLTTSLPKTNHFGDVVPLIVNEYRDILQKAQMMFSNETNETKNCIEYVKSTLFDSLLECIISYSWGYCTIELLSLLCDCISEENATKLFTKSQNNDNILSFLKLLTIEDNTIDKKLFEIQQDAKAKTMNPLAFKCMIANKLTFRETYREVMFALFGMKNNELMRRQVIKQLLEININNTEILIELMKYIALYSRYLNEERREKPEEVEVEIVIDDYQCSYLFMMGKNRGIIELCTASLECLSELLFGYTSWINNKQMLINNQSNQFNSMNRSYSDILNTLIRFPVFRNAYFTMLHNYYRDYEWQKQIYCQNKPFNNEKEKENFIQLYRESTAKFIQDEIISNFEALFSNDILCPEHIETFINFIDEFGFKVKQQVEDFIVNYIFFNWNKMIEKDYFIKVMRNIDFKQKCPDTFIDKIIEKKDKEIFKEKRNIRMFYNLLKSNPQKFVSSFNDNKDDGNYKTMAFSKDIENLITISQDQLPTIKTFVYLLLQNQFKIDTKCLTELIEHFKEKEELDIEEKEIVEYYIISSKETNKIINFKDKKFATLMTQKYADKNKQNTNGLFDQINQALDSNNGDLLVLYVHNWIEETIKLNEKKDKQRNNENIKKFIINAIQKIDIMPDHICSCFIDLLVNKEKFGLNIIFDQNYFEEIPKKLQDNKIKESDYTICLIQLLKVVFKKDESSLSRMSTIMINKRRENDYGNEELTNDQLLDMLKYKKDVSKQLLSKKQMFINRIKIDKNTQDIELEIVYYLLKRLNEVFRKNKDEWKDEEDYLCSKVLANCDVLDELYNEYLKKAELKQEEIIQMIGICDVVFEGCKFIYNVQTMRERKLLQDNQVKRLVNIVQHRWKNEILHEKTNELKIICLDVIRIPMGKTKEFFELRQKVEDMYPNRTKLQERNNDLGKSFVSK